jgi:hypothetical protein
VHSRVASRGPQHPKALSRGPVHSRVASRGPQHPRALSRGPVHGRAASRATQPRPVVRPQVDRPPRIERQIGPRFERFTPRPGGPGGFQRPGGGFPGGGGGGGGLR